MYWLKGCPRCRGDLYLVRDLEGRYVSCLQCGKVLTPPQEEALLRQSAEAAERSAIVRLRVAVA